MSVPTSIADLSTTAASNSPAGSEAPSTLDDNLRALSAIVKQNVSKGADIASSSTITIPASGSYFVVTGTTGISAISDTNAWDGREATLRFSGALTLTHSSSLILPGAVNKTTAAGDVLKFVRESTGAWRCSSFSSAASVPLVTSDIGVSVQEFMETATQEEMEAGTEAELRNVSPLRVAQAISELAVARGVGGAQTWQDMSASRTSGTTYYNTTEIPIMCVVIPSQGASTLTVVVDGVTVGVSTGATGARVGQSFIVPVGDAYVCTSSTGVFNNWSELR